MPKCQPWSPHPYPPTKQKCRKRRKCRKPIEILTTNAEKHGWRCQNANPGPHTLTPQPSKNAEN